jgi:pimeloyl-ACP methyl ester carboxylesterase
VSTAEAFATTIRKRRERRIVMEANFADISIYYETCGDGRPVVMLPGRPSDHHIMARFMEPLFTNRDGYLRIYPDLPGTGRSPAVDRLATHDDMLEAMLGFIDAVLPGERFVLAGYSYGGYLARGVIARRAESIDGVMLCAPQVKADPAQAHLSPRTVVVENPALLAEIDPDIAPIVEDLVVVQTRTVAETLQAVFTAGPEPDHSFNRRLEAAGPASFEVGAPPSLFAGPTLIVTARQDHLCGYQDAWDLLDHYPRATFAVLDRAGHFVPIEQSALCQALMREWLDRVTE